MEEKPKKAMVLLGSIGENGGESRGTTKDMV